ncbi:MAG: nitrous oxide reductase family maturation protein NosD [Nitrospirae bacterium]|nr:nitrous oxide reductase family maturation protein NosD [Nitrospirota bacterium]
MNRALWIQIWQMKAPHVVAFAAFLCIIILLILLKDRLTKKRKLFNILRYAVLLVAFLYVGGVLKAQPTTTNIVIILNQLKALKFPMGLFLMEPFIFLSFVFIFLTIFIWGRGVFCGWLCPYGAMLELLNKLRRKLLPGFHLKPPQTLHNKLLYLKYVVFFIIVAVSFYSFMLSEYLTEVEPFRTFVLKMHRQWYFNLYFLFLTGASVVVYRAFCRYLCPLGGALALPSVLQVIPFVKLKRYELCGTCRICEKQCPYNVIRHDGSINRADCLYCLDCQMNYHDEQLCPALKKKKREESRASGEVSLTTATTVFVLIVLFLPPLSWAKTLVVGSEYKYKTITESIKQASTGDTIKVMPGVYQERFTIDKPLKLVGVDYPRIIARTGNIIEVKASDVVIQGFEFSYKDSNLSRTDTAIYIHKGTKSVVVSNNRMDGVIFGIWNVEGRDILIEGNTITGIKSLDRELRGNCINLTGTERAHVIGNSLNYCRDGIYMEVCHDAEVIDNEIRHSRYSIHSMWVDRGKFNGNRAIANLVGLAIMYTKHSEVKGNLAAGNQTHGLLLLQAVRTNISNNIIIGNTKGIFLYNSVLNRVSSNLVMNNQVGIHNWGGSEDNIVTGNTIIHNEIQVKYVSSRDQYWDGNYWSDYLGWDMTGDGIGDVPYESNTVVDWTIYSGATPY